MISTALIASLYQLPEAKTLRETFHSAKERLSSLRISQIGYELKLVYCNRFADTNPATWDAVELMISNSKQTSYKTFPAKFVGFLEGIGFNGSVLLDCPDQAALKTIVSFCNALPQVSFFIEPYQHCIAINDPKFGNKDCDNAIVSRLLIPTYDPCRLKNYAGQAKSARWYPFFDPEQRLEVLDTLQNYDQIIYSNGVDDPDAFNTLQRDFRDFSEHGLLTKVIPLGTIEEISQMVCMANQI